MKNILKLLCLIVLLSFMPNAFALEYQDYMLKKFDKVSNVYVTKKNSEHEIYDYMYIIARASDQKHVYCIEPGIHINESALYTGHLGSDGLIMSKLSIEELERIKLIAYFGYGYFDNRNGINHLDKKWYAVAQKLIWDIAPNGHEIYFTKYLQGPKVDLFSEETAELESLISNYNKIPSFEREYNILLGDTLRLIDSNNVLSYFDLSVSNNNINAIIDGNNLIINALESGNVTITLTKKFDNYGTVPIVYSADNSQTLFIGGNLEPITMKININVKGGKLVITKLDSENKSLIPQGDALLAGAKYDLLDENKNFITTLEINSEGIAKTQNVLVPNKKYYLIEKDASKGYLLDKKMYEFYVDESLTKELVLYEDIIKRKVELYKVFGSEKTGIMKAEANVTFDIYLKSLNQYYSSITTDIEGHASIYLPYGTWIFKQVNGEKNYEMAPDFEIVVDENNRENITKIVSDFKKKAKVKVIKIDDDTKETIPLDGIKFKIKSLETNEYVCQDVIYPTLNKLCTYETKNGEFITPDALDYGSYALEEIEQEIEGYILNNKPLIFEISDNSITKENLVEVKFFNKKIKGSLQLKKVNSLTNMPLADALIGVYDELGNMIDTGRTNIDGIYKIDNLTYGRYYYKELEAPDGYILDNDIHFFDIDDDIIITKILSNEKDPPTIVEVPSTGIFSYNLYLLFEIIAIFIGVGLILYGKKKYI